MQIFNTHTQRLEPAHFAKTVRMYVCGITPYDAAHLGHAFVYTQFDVLNRHLQAKGHDVIYVRNVTDLDDDTLRTARQREMHFQVLARGEAAIFEAHLARLGLLPPTHTPFVTDHVPAIITMVEGLLGTGAAYALPDGRVYIDTSHELFLTFSQLDPSTALEYFTERGGDPDAPGKRQPLDFLLWQPSAPGEPAWPTPWGAGRPGWHIECSTLISEHLGATLDIHGGGSDLIFPHHEAECMQSQLLTGQGPLARFWMHVGMVGLDGTKMSKSLGNLVFLGDLLDDWAPDVVRTVLLEHHYQDNWDFTMAMLPAAQARVQAWQSGPALSPGDLATLTRDIQAALDSNMNTPAALECLDAASAQGNVMEAAQLLGYGQTLR